MSYSTYIGLDGRKYTVLITPIKILKQWVVEIQTARTMELTVAQINRLIVELQTAREYITRKESEQ